MTTTVQKSRRITWVDGLKGIACLLIFTHHFSLEYFSCAYFGKEMESLLPFQLDIELSYQPYGVLINGNFWVCIFVTLASFLTAVSVLRHCAENWQEKLSGMIIKRYVRLAIPCGLAGILYWLLRQFLAGRFAYYRGLENNLSFVRMLWHAFVKTWIVPDDEVLGPYWMLYIVFWGTFIAILLALATRYSRKRTLPLFFALAALLLWAKDAYYLCVVFGVLLAYLMENNVLSDSRHIRWLALIPLSAGLYLGGYPSYAQPVFFYRYLGKINTLIFKGGLTATYHVLAAALLIWGIIMCAPLQKWLSAKPLQWLGSVSVGVFVLHVTVIQFLGRPLQKLFLGIGMPYALMVLIVYLILLPALLLLAWGFRNTVEHLTNKALSRL